MLDSSVVLVVKRSQAEDCRSPEIPTHPIFLAPRKTSLLLWFLYQFSDCLHQSAGVLCAMDVVVYEHWDSCNT